MSVPAPITQDAVLTEAVAYADSIWPCFASWEGFGPKGGEREIIASDMAEMCPLG